MTDAPTIGQEEARTGKYFDATAPIVREVLAAREDRILIHGPQGTGKTRMLLEKAYAVATKYPGCRILFLRRFRKWLTQTVLVTWEQEVLVDGALVPDRVQRENRARYLFRNGSEVVVAGLDDPQGVFSSQYDLIFIFEATEVSQAVAEQVDGRLRNGKVPYQQLVMDTNPSSPNHWLHVRMLSGWCRGIAMRHQDNPAFYRRGPDGQPVLTDRGKKYLERLEKNYTGVRYLRLVKGQWVQAEGVVYDGFDTQMHLTSRAELTARGIDYRAAESVWAFDFGFNDPLVWQRWINCGDDVWCLVRELHLPGLLVEDAAARVLELSAGDRPPLAIVCDHDREDRATLERHLGAGTVPADKKSILVGIDRVKARMRVGDNNRPRLLVCVDSLENAPAPDRLEAGEPVGLVQELENYQWKPDKAAAGGFLKDEPLDRWNHSCDAMRYAVGWIDQFAAGMAALPPTAGLGGGYDHPGTGRPYDDPRGLSVGGDELTLHDYV